MTAVQVLGPTETVSKPFEVRQDCDDVLFRVSHWVGEQEVELQCRIRQRGLDPDLIGDTWQPADIVWDRRPPHVLIPRLLRMSCEMQYRVRAKNPGVVVHAVAAHGGHHHEGIVKFIPPPPADLD